MATVPKSLADAVWPRVRKLPDCWEWQGWVDRDGYGSLTNNGRTLKVSHAVLELTVGPVPVGKVVRHRCKNHRCVRPEHLYLADRGGTEVTPLDEALWSRVQRRDGCWEWTGYRNRGGYGEFENAGKHCLAHRVAYELTYGPIPDGMFVCHDCDNPACVRPDHLHLGAPTDNTGDMMTRNRWRGGGPTGERSGSAKLTEVQVREIRARHTKGQVSMRQLAREYGVRHPAISYILTRKTWKHVE